MKCTILPPKELVELFEGTGQGVEFEGEGRLYPKAFEPFFGRHPVISTTPTEVRGTPMSVPTVTLEVAVPKADHLQQYVAGLSILDFATHLGFVAQARNSEINGPMQALPAEYLERNLTQQIRRNLHFLVNLLTKYYMRNGSRRPIVEQARFNPPSSMQAMLADLLAGYPEAHDVRCVSIRTREQSTPAAHQIDGLLLLLSIKKACDRNSTPTFNPRVSGVVLGIRSSE
ncbi:MAG: hypothetical protein WC775_01335 [Patescibacteria group bacterium]|jgi:hypothetical protein